MNRRLLFCLGISLCTLFACIKNPATKKVHARLLSNESERRIGAETKKQILQEYKVFTSTPVNAYVNSVGQKLARVSDRPTVDYNFTILDSDLINAFAAPGGYVFVTRGLLDNITDEAELAMVLGHEIGHVAAMHGVQMIQKEMGQNALSILGTIGAALTVGPEAMLMVANTANLFSSLYLLGYSREKELEADNLGLQYMLRAGYDPHAALRFLEQLQAADPEQLKGWDLYFRTHPPTTERIRIIRSLVGEQKEDTTNSNKKEYEEIKNYLPRVDVTERGEIKGHTYSNEKHHLVFEVPKNWVLGYFHAASLVSFETENKKAEGRLQVVNLASSTPNAEALADEYAFASGYKLQSGRRVLYRAGYGFLGRYLGVSPSGEGLDIRLFATIRHGRGYVLQVGAPPDEVESYMLDLEQITRGLSFTDG